MAILFISTLIYFVMFYKTNFYIFLLAGIGKYLSFLITPLGQYNGGPFNGLQYSDILLRKWEWWNIPAEILWLLVPILTTIAGLWFTWIMYKDGFKLWIFNIILMGIEVALLLFNLPLLVAIYSYISIIMVLNVLIWYYYQDKARFNPFNKRREVCKWK